jgi:hypothetical protein
MKRSCDVPLYLLVQRAALIDRASGWSAHRLEGVRVTNSCTVIGGWPVTSAMILSSPEKMPL